MTRTHSRSRCSRLRWLRLPVLSAFALAASAGPASAAETIQGSGAGTGYSTIDESGPQPEVPLCLFTSQSGSYIIDMAEGSVTAAETPTSVGQYTGALQVTIALSGGFYFGPAGTFSDDTCTTPTEVAATITVTAQPSGTVICPADNGWFQRVNTTITFREANPPDAPVVLDNSCSVPRVGGGTAVTVSPVTHAFVGNEYPCLDVWVNEPHNTCPSPVDTVHVQGDWTVAGGG